MDREGFADSSSELFDSDLLKLQVLLESSSTEEGCLVEKVVWTVFGDASSRFFHFEASESGSLVGSSSIEKVVSPRTGSNLDALKL
jgi:hypothetical protein